MSSPPQKRIRLSDYKGIPEQGIRDYFNYSGIIDKSFLKKSVWWWRSIDGVLKKYKIGTCKDFQNPDEFFCGFPLRFLEDLKIQQEYNRIEPIMDFIFYFELSGRIDPPKNWGPAISELPYTRKGVPLVDARFSEREFEYISCEDLNICLSSPDSYLKKQFLAFVDRKQKEYGIEKTKWNKGQANRTKYNISSKFQVLEIFDKITILGQNKDIGNDKKANLRKAIRKFYQG